MNDKKLDFYTNLAFSVAAQGTCPRAQVGAVLVRDDRVLAMGYNGAPRGVSHCTTDGCWVVNNHCLRAAHAEANAIVNAAFLGVSTKQAILFCTHTPCIHCLKLIVNAGIQGVYFAQDYEDPSSLPLLRFLPIWIHKYQNKEHL